MHSNTLLLILSTLVSLVSVVGAGSNEASKIWLAENSKKEGVITLPSGLQYKVVREGTGEHHPTVDSPCLCHYEGTLIDGTVFDSSYGRGEPTTFAPNQVIKGWTEAMQLMTTGSKWEVNSLLFISASRLYKLFINVRCIILSLLHFLFESSCTFLVSLPMEIAGVLLKVSLGVVHSQPSFSFV